ncbi:MAG: Tellurium resistance protein TerA [Rhodospirillales bacterium]|nr:Tellurium resistance protein TerA [Rhodospirillales bacterium]MCB9964768.1 Tellurium resistance protein TerA [Rhodospirillales bacterium]MCB9980652.1 Tellurium resistance protein TerA [Rhodospirillales bacterium]
MANGSKSSLEEATRGRAHFSEHGESLGAAGFHDLEDAAVHTDDLLVDSSGESVVVDAPKGGFPEILINLSWDRIQVEKDPGFFEKLFKGNKKVIEEEPVDLDLGCLYELQNGDRGCLQAFGDMYGSFSTPPYIAHQGDERTGDPKDVDEQMIINGAKWNEIKRILFYIYIYQGTPNWRRVKPEIMIDIPGENDLKMTPHVTQGDLVMCAVGTLENLDGAMKLTNHSEYFRGHAEMDRAFGYGLEWEDGAKD